MDENKCLGYTPTWIETSWRAIVCFRTESCFPLVIKLALSMLKGCLPLCHWARLQWFVLSQRCAVHTELIWRFYTHHTLVDWPCITCTVNLLWWGSISCVMPEQRTRWQCHGCVVYGYDLCLASCLPHLLHFCAVEASNAEQTLPLHIDLYPCFQKTTAELGCVTQKLMREWLKLQIYPKLITKVYVLPKHLELSGMFKRTHCFENA